MCAACRGCCLEMRVHKCHTPTQHSTANRCQQQARSSDSCSNKHHKTGTISTACCTWHGALQLQWQCVVLQEHLSSSMLLSCRWSQLLLCMLLQLPYATCWLLPGAHTRRLSMMRSTWYLSKYSSRSGLSAGDCPGMRPSELNNSSSSRQCSSFSHRLRRHSHYSKPQHRLQRLPATSSWCPCRTSCSSRTPGHQQLLLHLHLHLASSSCSKEGLSCLGLVQAALGLCQQRRHHLGLSQPAGRGALQLCLVMPCLLQGCTSAVMQVQTHCPS